MIGRTFALAALISMVGLAVSDGQAAEPDSIDVTLWNKPNGTMGIALDKQSVPAGPVEFIIKNSSADMMHEFLVAPWAVDPSSLPYNGNKDQVAEAKIPYLQGQEDMKTGLKTTLRLDLVPGSYIVFCNQPGHYKMGMYARLNVTGSS